MKQRILRKIAWIILFIYSYELMYPIRAFALTSGPSAPETQGFTPVGTTDMVDLFSGDFSYNIPLLDVGGYPVNLGYHSGIGVEQEASWVGLGWSLTPGAINRNMRGLPDDFNGDIIEKTNNIKANWTLGIGGGGGAQMFGIEQLGVNLSGGKFYNSYNGIGSELGANFSANISDKVGGGLTAGFNFNTQSGLDLNAGLSLSAELGDRHTVGLSANGGINSRQGLKDVSFGASLTVTQYDDKNSNEKRDDDEKSTGSQSGSLSTNYSFSYPTFTPTSDLDFSNFSISFQATAGGMAQGLHPNGTVKGYFTRQGLINKESQNSAYGQMFLGNINSSIPNMMMDFNREKDIPVTSYIKTLAIPIATFDQFSVEGEGIGGQYQLSRNDAGFYFDQKKTDKTNGFSGGLEVGGGVVVHAGGDVYVNSSNTKGGKWEEDNALNEYAVFTNLEKPTDDLYNPAYEPFYFKNTTEASIFTDNNQLIAAVNGPSPVMPGVSGGPSPSGLNTIGGGSIDRIIKNKQRIIRNSNFTVIPISLLDNEITHENNVGLTKVNYINVYDPNEISWGDAPSSVTPITYSEMAGTNSNEIARQNHIGEIHVLNDKGSTYVYGIPAYNLKSVDVSFRTEQQEHIGDYYSFDPVHEASKDNNKGKDNFYSKTVIPAYAYSYLLTGILSPDYVDVGNDGITDNDFGTAIKFNYSTAIENTIRDTGNFYSWRTPTKEKNCSTTTTDFDCEDVLANYQEGMYALHNDQTANYSYGMKRLWFIRSIETKTMVAFFYTSNRKDALGVQRNEEKGELRGKYLSEPTEKDLSFEQKLDSIVLYSKAELNSSASPVPIKVVHFEYNYSLCPNVDNQEDADSGKLTLRKIYFTYGRNTRGELNSYVFDYKNQITLEDYSVVAARYHPRKADRWGNYQNPNLFYGLELYPDQSVFPYTIQDTVMQKEFCDVWCLKTIHLPSGGKIEVEYEPDDYAYVQNKKAGEMLLISGFVHDPNDDSEVLSAVSNPSENKLFSGNDLNNYVLVDLKEGQSINQMTQDLNGKIYYTCYVKVSRDNEDARWEYIKGYAEIDGTNYGLISDISTPPSGHTYLAYVKVKSISVHKFNEDESSPDGEYNPICITALQTLRLSLPGIAYPGSDFSDPGDSPSATDLLGMATGLITSIKDMINGFNDEKLNAGSCKKVNCDRKSWIRLSTPDFKKIGGGNRVKKIKLHDAWNEFLPGTSEKDFYYGQEYNYKIYPTHGPAYSSGVALWEPALGSDENLFKLPVFYEENIKCAPDNSYYVEEPFGEMLYPSAGVGYSEVRVKNLARDNVTRTATGYTINKFYTALDYPTKSKRTAIELFPYKTKLSLLFLKFKTESGLTASQGFSVEVNDMHGKQKSVENYNENGSLISFTKYNYKVGDMVKTIGPDGEISNKVLGCDFDSWGDSRYQETKTTGMGLSGNVETILAVIPVPIPVPLPSYSKDIKNFHSMSLMKYIRWHGVLDKVTKMENGSTIITSNLLYDRETGNVVVTATQNEWGDSLYSIKLPAYWAYNNMGQAYKNNWTYFSMVDLAPTSGIVTADTIDISPFKSLLTTGDEIYLQNLASPKRVNAVKNIDGDFVFIDESGTLMESYYGLKGYIIKSGRKNLLDKLIEEKTSLRKSSIGKFADVECDSCGFFGIPTTSEGTTTWVYHPACFEDLENPPIWETPFSTSDCYVLDTVLTDVITTFSERWPVNDLCGLLNPTDQINPYRTGNLGNWKPDTVYQFKNLRLSGDDTYTNIRKNGEFVEKVFWKNPHDDDSRIVPNYIVKPNWIPSNMITLYDENGNEVENSNSLGIYSAALFGYKHTLTTAVGSNARYQELANDNFEDYDFLSSSLCSDNHFSFKASSGSDLSTKYAHSGFKSLKVTSGNDNDLPVSFEEISSAGSQDIIDQHPEGFFVFGDDGKLPAFEPFYESTYIISGWARTDENCDYNVAQSAEIEIHWTGGGGPITINPTGPVIEGWQRIEGSFTIPSAMTDITISLKAIGTDVYFDDLRIHPYNSNVKSFVYNPSNLRLMATLDENNYATFYEYDESGNLIRVKKETEKGVLTLQENRSTYKQ